MERKGKVFSRLSFILLVDVVVVVAVIILVVEKVVSIGFCVRFFSLLLILLLLLVRWARLGGLVVLRMFSVDKVEVGTHFYGFFVCVLFFLHADWCSVILQLPSVGLKLERSGS